MWPNPGLGAGKRFEALPHRPMTDHDCERTYEITTATWICALALIVPQCFSLLLMN